MKTFLVPFDYSETAENAAIYALDLAHQEKAKVVLLHVFNVPYPVAHDTYVPLVSMEELEKDAKDSLKKYKQKLLKKTGSTVEVDCKVTPDFVVDGIVKFKNHNRVDLIVMGITGGSKLKEVLIGSNTLRVIQQCHTNMLIVPKDAKYRTVKKIALATNYEFEDENLVKKALKHYTDLFHAQVVALHVNTYEEINTPAKRATVERFNAYFKENEFFTKEIEPADNNVAEEIETYVQEKKCDWVGIIPRKHNIIDKLFNPSITKKLAFHLHVPVLVIHDEK